MTTTMVDALAELGVETRENEDVVFVRIDKDGRAFHETLAEYEADDEPVPDDLYIATGRFAKGTVTGYKGRSEDNLKSVWTVPFDCDLKDYLDKPKADVWAMPDDELDSALGSLRKLAVEIFKEIGLPPSRIVETGYGVAIFLDVAESDQADIESVRTAHKPLVARANKLAGFKMCDTAVSDAGTRIMRVPGGANTKGPRRRYARTVHEGGASYATDMLLDAVTFDDEATLHTPCTGIGGVHKWRSNPGGVDYCGLCEIDKPQPATREPIRTRLESGADEYDVINAATSAASGAWRDGERHGLALALAGYLAKNGVSESGVEAVLMTSGGEARDMQKIVRSTFERLRSGGIVAGYQSLVDIIGEAQELAAVVDKYWQSRNPLTQKPEIKVTFGGASVPLPEKTVFAAPRDRYRVEFDDLPDAVLYGAVGEYVDLMTPTTEAPPQFHLGAFVAMVGAMAGRTVYVPYADWELFANQYVMLVGTTGSSRKDTAINRALKTLVVADIAAQAAKQAHNAGRLILDGRPDLTVAYDVASETALIKTLSESKSVLLVQSELSSLFSKARRKGTETLLDVIIRAWDAPDVLENNSISNKITADRPTLSIIGATQPDRLREDMGNRETASGFANRWLPIPGGSNGPNAFPPPVNKPRRDALIGRIAQRLADIRASGKGQPVAVELAPECMPLWEKFYNAHWAQSYADLDVDALITRYPTLVIKLALLFSITEDSRSIRPRIELHHLEAAIALIQWAYTQTKKIAGEWGASEEARIEGRITGSLAKNGGAMKRRMLYQNTYVKGSSASLWARVLKALVDNKVLVEVGDAVALADVVGVTA